MILLVFGCSGEVVELQQEHLAEVEVSISPDALQAAEGLDELELGLDELSVDSLGRELELSEIVQLQLMVFPELGHEAVAAGLSDDSLVQADVGAFLEFEPGEPLRLQEDFAFEGEGSWLVIAADASGDSRRLAFLEPVAGGPEALDWSSDSAQITVDLSWGEPLPWGQSYDWSGLTLDVQGRELLHRQLDLFSVARVELEMEELAERFIELEELAIERVDVELEGQVKLSAEQLPGFSSGEGWVMGLSCSSCSSPVPRVLVHMED